MCDMGSVAVTLTLQRVDFSSCSMGLDAMDVESSPNR